MFKSSKSLLVMSVLAIIALAVILSGCEKQAQSKSQVQTGAKSSLAAPAQANAPAEANVPACKAAVKKECKVAKKECKAAKKTCPAKAEKKCGMAKAKKCVVADTNAVVKQVEQVACPISGKAVNKEIFTEYKGKKVYFCCPGCKAKFEKDPEKYIDKLPQFK